MKTFFQLREELNNLNEAEDSKALDTQYDKAEKHVTKKHGTTASGYAHHKGDTAVLAEPSSPGPGKLGSTALGNHDTHNITAVSHADGSMSGVALKYGKKATHHDVMKQAPKVHSSLAKKIADEHNSAAGKIKESTIQEYTAHGNYDPHQGNDEGITAGKGKLDKQYHKAEAHVKSKHGSGGYSYAHHKGDTAVSAITGDESSPYSHKEGSSSLGNHDTHNITAVVHKDGSTSAVNLKYGHRATHHDVMKQAPKVHHSLAKKIAHEHNASAAKVTD
jgi:hypothetical protein